MKTSLLFISTLLLAQFAFAQSYEVELANFTAEPGNALAWDGQQNAPALHFMATKGGFMGDFKKGRIFLENEYTYSIERKGHRYFLYNGEKETQMVRHKNFYMTLDGVQLKRKRSATGEKISIIHPNGTTLAEGRIKSKILGKYTLVFDINEDSKYSQELAAMLSVDLVETLRNRLNWDPVITYAATRN